MPEAIATGMQITFAVATVLIITALAIAVSSRALVMRREVAAAIPNDRVSDMPG
jgi:hypothetical protein